MTNSINKIPILGIRNTKQKSAPTYHMRVQWIMLIFVCFILPISAQYQLSVPAVTVDKLATVAVPVSLSNSNAVTALQFEFNYPADMEYVGVSISNRKVDHTVSASVVSVGKLRVVVYSPTQKAFVGTSGAVVAINLKAHTMPGTSTISLSNVVLSNDAGASLSATTSNGTVSVNGPRAEVSTTALNFGRVANGNTGNATVTVHNRGNQAFNITSAVSSDARFSVSTSLPTTVAANSSKTLNVSFNNATGDIDVAGILTLTTTDPAPERASFAVALQAQAYSINTVQIAAVAGKAGAEIRVPITMNSQSAISGIQLDINLPDSAILQENSLAIASFVPSTFQFLANQIGTRLKILIFSNDNSIIPPSNGELCAFKVKMNNYPANYNISFVQTLLSNTHARNVVSAASNGSLQLSAPRLATHATLAYGNINVGQDIYEKSFSISNTGNEPLIVSSIVFSNASFRLKNISLPLTLAANQNQSLVMQLTDVEPGQKTASMQIVSNDSKRLTSVSLSAQIIANFELAALNVTAQAGNTTHFDFSIKNDLTVTAFQFDLALPSAFTLATLNLLPTNRIAGWNLEYSKLSNGQFRILAYSLNSVGIANKDGIVFSVPFQLPIDIVAGQYDIVLNNIVIANAKGQNVLTKSTNAVLTVTSVIADAFDNVDNAVDIRYLGNAVLVQAAPGACVQIFSIQGHLLHQINTTTQQTTFTPISNNILIVKVVSCEKIYVKKLIK